MTQEELDALMKIGEELESDDEPTPSASVGDLSLEDLGGANELNLSSTALSSSAGELNLGAPALQNGANEPNLSATALSNGASELDLGVSALQKGANAQNAENLNELNINTPPSNEHKVVHQLDEVTRDSEEKAIEMMDRLENIGKFFNHIELALEDIKENISKNQATFSTLNAKFPHIQTFKTALNASTKSLEASENIFKLLQQGQDEVFVSMDAMQYQDIHRQKIERAVNVMRALNRYMNSLFEGDIDDSKRVSSAVHIAGDSTKDVMNDGDIEDLIASLRGNK